MMHPLSHRHTMARLPRPSTHPMRRIAWMALLLSACGVPSSHANPKGLASWCVTNGQVSVNNDNWLSITAPSVRMIDPLSTTQHVDIKFRYIAPTNDIKPLASGELRRQIGLKLLAEDDCNLLYVMWHIHPDSAISVSVKHNAGEKTHAECHADGYETLTPYFKYTPPVIHSGEEHQLSAQIEDTQLSVFADTQLVWRGDIGNHIQGMHGHVGLRSDNAQFDVKFLTPPQNDVATAIETAATVKQQAANEALTCLNH